MDKSSTHGALKKKDGGTHKGPGSGKAQGGGRRGGKDRLKAKEEEYRRMNAELEEKTCELVKEAEELLEGNLSIISDLEVGKLPGNEPEPTRSHDVSQDHIDVSGDRAQKKAIASTKTKNRSAAATSSKRPSTSNPPKKLSSASQKRPFTSQSHLTRPHPPSQTSPEPVGRSRDMSAGGSHELDLLLALQRMEAGGESDEHEKASKAIVNVNRLQSKVMEGDLLPPTVDDMGTEATIRFLKAKLRVMQEELDHVCEEMGMKDKLVATSTARIKELETEKAKFQGHVQSLAAQLEKHKRSTEEYRLKAGGLEGQLTSVRKELDGMKTAQKRVLSQHGAVEVRLNRALEDVERYKDAHQKSKADAKESGKVERQKIDSLVAENRMLEKQRSELMTAFKKQMKLIDILKRQKMHIEAAKMLSFTEDEFVKALDWGTT